MPRGRKKKDLLAGSPDVNLEETLEEENSEVETDESLPVKIESLPVQNIPVYLPVETLKGLVLSCTEISTFSEMIEFLTSLYKESNSVIVRQKIKKYRQTLSEILLKC